MGKKLSSDQMKLYKRVDEIHFKDWGLIGVSELGGPSDEYQVYLPQVFGLALENENPIPIAEYLAWVTTELMGMNAAKEYATLTEAYSSVFEYIEVFYNRVRRHSATDYRSPYNYEQQYLAQCA
jgi:hypothetical protein